ncbi:GntR family transcriptional regulator [Actinomadura madurae]
MTGLAHRGGRGRATLARCPRIAQTYGVAHATAARAVQELTARGAVVAVPGRGTFLADADEGK